MTLLVYDMKDDIKGISCLVISRYNVMLLSV